MLTAYPHRIDGGPDRRFKVYQRDRVVGAPRTGGAMGPLVLMAASVALPYAIAAVEKGGPPALRWARRHGPEYRRRAGDGARRLLRRGPDAGAGEPETLEVLRAAEAWVQADAREAAAGNAHERAVAQGELAVALDALLASARRAVAQDAGAQGGTG